MFMKQVKFLLVAFNDGFNGGIVCYFLYEWG